MLRVHHLIDQIAKGTLEIGYDPTPPLPSLMPNPDIRIPAFIEPLMLSQKFALDYRSIADDNLKATGFDLWREKILRPPHDITWWEIDIVGKYTEGLLVRHDRNEERTTIDIFTCWSGQWIDHGVQCGLTPDHTPREYANLLYDDKYYDFEQTKELANFAVMHFVNACCLLISKEANAETIAAPQALNVKRDKQGKAPIFEHRVITIPALTVAKSADGGTHASPRLHWRRGHVRHLPSGMKTAVRPCLVGLAEKGIITKDYLVAVTKEDR